MPRKAKDVTPTPVEIPDDVMAALSGMVVITEIPDTLTPQSLTDVATTLVPLAQQIRATISDIALIPIARATPAKRTELVNLRDELYRTMRDLSTWIDAIDISFRRAAADTGATEFVLEDGVVKVEPQRGEWVVNVPALRAELAEFVAHGVISKAEFDSIFTTTVVEKANGTRLNYFASKRGEELAEAINRSRMWKDGDPAAARVRFQRASKP
jgi:hypothetical protein